MAKVVVANDHGAVELAQRLIEHLRERGYEVNYLGTDKNESVDYPDKAKEACLEYLRGGYEFGILLCGTGIGISISANKIRGIRCSLLADCYSAELTKRHNNPNFIAFGGRVDYKDDPVKMLDAFLDAEFEGGRHERRIEKMMALEELCF
ncbi:MAG: ribose 5-phosphate isomerase B [Bullifex sp.]